LHAFPSEHEVPFVTGVYTQPVAGLHVSVVHGLLSLQVSAVPDLHWLPWHVSTPLHAFPSEQDDPFGTAVCVHRSFPSSQASTVHGAVSEQSGAAPGTQPTPAWHVSSPLQNSPSSQSAFVRHTAHRSPTSSHISPGHGIVDAGRQPDDGLQLSVPLQKRPSSHTSGAPARQAPPAQASPAVQALPSSQALVLLV